MPDGRVSILTEGPSTEFDPKNPGPFKTAAGSQFVSAKGGVAWVRTEGGVVMAVYEGWAVIRPDGSEDGYARFADPTNVGDGEIWRTVG